MPSESILKEKKKIVLEMTERLKSQAGVFVDYKGITVNEDTEMRVKMREANVEYSIIKNSLMKFAVKNVGFDELEAILVGTTSLATGNEDPIAPARIIKEYSDKLQNYFEIKAGFMDGRVLSIDEVNAIARIPALPVLQAQLLGTMLAPITSLAIVLKEIAEKGGVPVDADVEIPKEEASATETPVEEATPVSGAAETEETPAAAEAAETPTETAAEAPAEEAEVKQKTPAKKAKKTEETNEAKEEKAKKASAKKTAASVAQTEKEKPAKEEPAKKESVKKEPAK